LIIVINKHKNKKVQSEIAFSFGLLALS